MLTYPASFNIRYQKLGHAHLLLRQLVFCHNFFFKFWKWEKCLSKFFIGDAMTSDVGCVLSSRYAHYQFGRRKGKRTEGQTFSNVGMRWPLFDIILGCRGVAQLGVPDPYAGPIAEPSKS